MTIRYAEFNEPRLAELYDYFCPLGPDSDFFLNLAKGIGPERIIDFGCGTGILTVELAKYAKQVTGIEPAMPMLDIARQRPQPTNIEWVEGSTEQFQGPKSDLVIMTSHVAQFFLEDRKWNELLIEIRQSLSKAGVLIFDARNPEVKNWESWDRSRTERCVQLPNGEATLWNELISVEGQRVRYQLHYQLPTGEHLVSENELIYRNKTEIIESLTVAGLATSDAFGDWDGGPLTSDSEEMIFVAVKRT